MNVDTITVHVDRRGHANLDSLPLRYGFSFETNSLIKLTNCSNWGESNAKKRDGSLEIRHLVDAEFVKPNGEQDYGRFVLADHGYDHPNLVSVWKHDSSTERQLSDHLTKARKEGSLTTKKLIELHPYYASGEATSVAGLISTIAKIEELKSLNHQKTAEAAEEKAAKLSDFARKKLAEKHAIEDKLEIETELKEQAQKSAQLEAKAREGLEKKNKELEKRILEMSKSNPKYDGSQIEISDVANLIGVSKRKRKKSNGDEVNCVFLEFENGIPERKMDEVFDADNTIYLKAKEMIGEKVVTTTWRPEVFSSSLWFRDIFLWSDNEPNSWQSEPIQTTDSKDNERTYLNCPYSEKEECKAKGGKWDPEKKKWYVSSGTNLSDFSKWL